MASRRVQSSPDFCPSICGGATPRTIVVREAQLRPHREAGWGKFEQHGSVPPMPVPKVLDPVVWSLFCCVNHAGEHSLPPRRRTSCNVSGPLALPVIVPRGQVDSFPAQYLLHSWELPPGWICRWY